LKALAVLSVKRGPAFLHFGEVRELRTTHRGLEVGKTKVVPGDFVPVVADIASHSMATIKLYSLEQFFVICYNHAAFAGRDCFRRVKAVSP
jgi:hypothetical protein